ncbi:MAG: hemerythrin domain-containing protein [Bacillota bacterium]
MLLNFFQKQAKKIETPPVDAPGPEIAYDPALVAALTQQHRDLVTMLLKASSLAAQKRYDDVTEALAQFKAVLQEHLKRETTELHPYLAKHLKGENSKDLVKQMRHDTVMAERAVEGLIDHYMGYHVSERTVTRFSAELESASEEFSARLEREEAAFYTLYQAAETY